VAGRGCFIALTAPVVSGSPACLRPTLFIASYRFENPILTLYRATLPFLHILLPCVLIITSWPWLSLEGEASGESAGAELTHPCIDG